MFFVLELEFILVFLFQNQKLNRSVKPLILSTFGDIALAIGVDFKKYAEVVLNALHQASAIQADPNDYDLIDYFNELREGCLDAYTGILQGLKGNNNTPGIGQLEGLLQLTCACFSAAFIYLFNY